MTAGVRWPVRVGPRIHKPSHEVAQLFHVERAVLHLVIDVVGLGAGHLLALFVAAAPTGVIDGLARFQQFDGSVDALGLRGGLCPHLRGKYKSRRS